MARDTDHYILICATCQGRDAAAGLRGALAGRLPDGYAFRAVDCLAGCDRPLAVGFQASGKASYLFGDIDSPEDIAALSDFAAQYKDSASGWTCASDRPPALYTKTLARLPGLTLEPAE